MAVQAPSQPQPQPQPQPKQQQHQPQPQPKQHQHQHHKKKEEIQQGVKISSGTDGRRIGRWFIGETLGKGGYSWVKKGIDRKNGRIVALKFMERRLTSNGEWKKSQQHQWFHQVHSRSVRT